MKKLKLLKINKNKVIGYKITRVGKKFLAVEPIIRKGTFKGGCNEQIWK